jgi:hypothetical protein
MADTYRRCGCRDENGKLLGTHCPRLASDPKHGTWSRGRCSTRVESECTHQPMRRPSTAETTRGPDTQVTRDSGPLGLSGR